MNFTNENDEFSWIYKFGSPEYVTGSPLKDGYSKTCGIFNNVLYDKKIIILPLADSILANIDLKRNSINDIVCGDEHLLVLLSNGKLYAFGNNFWGQCGVDSTAETITAAKRVNVPLNPTKIYAAANSSICLVDGDVYVWGSPQKFNFKTLLHDFLVYNLLENIDGKGVGISYIQGLEDKIIKPEKASAISNMYVIAIGMFRDYLVNIALQP